MGEDRGSDWLAAQLQQVGTAMRVVASALEQADERGDSVAAREARDTLRWMADQAVLSARREVRDLFADATQPASVEL